MPLTVVVGAQYGSEGKGKTAYHFARQNQAIAGVRVGGPNSGHTIVHETIPYVFKQLPVTAVLGLPSILTPGAYLHLPTLIDELKRIRATPETVHIDPRAVIITDEDRAYETDMGLVKRIGSTGSGTGAALIRRIKRDGTTIRAAEIRQLKPYLSDTLPLINEYSNQGNIIVEGTQGYGLSLLHGLETDHATARDTTAAAVLSETGVSPFDVKEIVLVARAHPIRVAGNSGSLHDETSWETIGSKVGRPDLVEHTTVTNKVRRVGQFEADLVKRAVAANKPTSFVLNHCDYIASPTTPEGVKTIRTFVDKVSRLIQRNIDYIGVDANELTTFNSN